MSTLKEEKGGRAVSSESMLPYYTAASGRAVGMFNTSMGELQKQLYKGEYDAFKYAPMFESDFIQISKRGEVIDVHNRVRMVTVGIVSTSPILPLPNVMLLARPVSYIDNQSTLEGSSYKRKMRPSPHPSNTLELTRLLPLKFVKISVHDREKQQLRLKLASGRSFYLQLCPPSDAREDLFSYWEKLIYLLRPPIEGYSSTHAIPAGDGLEAPVFMAEDKSPSQEPIILHSEGEQDKVSIKSLHMGPEASIREKPEVIMATAAGEGFRGKGDTEKDLATRHFTIKGVPSMSPPSTPSVPSIAMGAAASRGPVSKAMVGVPLGMGTATAASQGPGLSVALAGTATGLAKEALSSAGVSLALAGAASMSGDSVSGTLVGATAGHEVVAIAGVGAITTMGTNNPLVSNLQSEGYMSERDGSQRVTPSSPDSSKERIILARRHSRQRERGHRRSERAASTGQKTSRRGMSSKDSQKSGHRSRGGRHSPSAHKATTHSPNLKNSRTSHKMGKNKTSVSTPPAAPPKKPSRIASFLRNFSRSHSIPNSKSTSVLTSMEDTVETSKASATEISLSTTIVENAEMMDMETITQLVSQAEEDDQELVLMMDAKGPQRLAPTLLIPSAPRR
ncbi:Golgi-associated RAB2 interactor protein 4-like [Monodelphis domestica]|uniref:Protein FAM71A-like n=1 Tax=Monodelphis domestica TaxID=13616 RepID=F7D404_MONDO|nr:Golgi-associated RAB2 interactor protein 4-like [Monodelphis domestica]